MNKTLIIFIIFLFLILVIFLGIFIYSICKKEKYFKGSKKELVALYINLLNRTDRKVEIINELKKIGIQGKNIIRVDAPKTEKGFVGCNLSHIMAISIAEKLDLPYVMIVEDDFCWKDYKIAKQLIPKIISNLEDWNIILLACNGTSTQINTKLPLKKVVECKTTSGYIINKKYYKTLKNLWIDTLGYRSNLELFDKRRWDFSGDKIWQKLQKKDLWYITDPVLGFQRKGYSDIENKFVNYKV